MLLTFVCGIWNSFGLPFGWLPALPTTWLLEYMTTVATFVSELSWAQSELDVQPWVWIIYVVVLVLLCIWMSRATKYDLRDANVVM